MSDQDLDKLFRNKLDDHREEPGAETWEKIRISVKQRKQAFPFLRVAAAILLLCLAAFFFWYTPGTDDMQIAENNTTAQQDDTAEVNQNSTNEMMKTQEEPNAETAESSEPETKSSPTPDQKKPVKEPVMDQRLAIADQNEEPSTEVDPDTPEKRMKVEDAAVQDALEEESIPLTDLPERESTMASLDDSQTLRFSIDEFSNAEKVPAESPVADADSEEGLKKVWSILRQVKESEAGLGELRELKNDLLAFGSDKEKKDKN